jgi:spore maturation protein CgeB
MRVVVLGLSITSSWGNGHATTYRALLRELSRSGHQILFLERDQPWYADNRDLPEPDFCEAEIYRTVSELKRRFADEIREADCVVIGSFVPDGIAVAEWATGIATGVTAFYDIDTPVTLAKLARGECDYVSPALIPKFDLFLSFTGGPTLRHIERVYGALRARALYCSVDANHYFPERARKRWTLGYLGTFSEDRQPVLETLLVEAARQMPGEMFIVAGPQYPKRMRWPANVERIQHLEPAAHRAFYNAQRFTLNVTRAEMVRSGWSPSVRLFEAAACGTPIISDTWPGLDDIFEPGREILIARRTDDVLRILRETPEANARAIGRRARERVLAEHTAAHRAAELEQLIEGVTKSGRVPRLEGVSS